MRHNLSEVNDLIKDRRTIYPEQFSSRKVHKELISNMLNNALWAPNHGMTQPWRFNVFTEDGISKLGNFLSEFYKENEPEDSFKEAKFQKLKNRPNLSTAIVAVGMKKDPRNKIREIEEIEAVACAIQNIYLTATAYGIGAFWSTTGVIYNNKINDFFGLEKEDRLLGLVYLGYPEGEWPKSHRKPLENFVEWVQN